MASTRTLYRAGVCLMVASQFLLAHDPHDPFAYVALSPNFAQDQTIFAATNALTIKIGVNALLKSTDGGVTWNVVQGLPGNSIASVIAFSPAYSQDQTIFTAGGAGLLESTNQGTSWTVLTTQSLAGMALSPNFATDNTLFVITTKKTILKSTNRGQTLTAVSVPALTAGLSVIAISPNYAIDNTLLLGGMADGIFLSTNSGSSWVQATAGMTLPQVTALTFSPAFSSDQTAFAATLGSGVLVSTSGGTLWKPSNSGISDLNATAIALSPTYSVDSTLWVATAVAGVFQSTNLGASWGPCATVPRMLSTLTTIHYQTIAAGNNGSGNMLYLGMYEGLWKTTAAGPISWQYIDTLPTRLIRYINLSSNFANDQTLFANTYGGGNVWSTNGGATWTFENTGMQFSYTDASGMSPNYSVDKTAFCGNFDGLEKTTNGGALWALTALPKGSYPRALGVSPNYALDSTLMVGSATKGQAGLYISTNGGTTWSPGSLGTGVVSIAMSPGFASDRTVFAAGNTAGLYKSTDAGTTWTLLTIAGFSGGLTKVTVSPSFPTDGTVFAAAVATGIYKSTNGGSTWSLVPGTTSMRALDLEVSPNYANDQTFFVGTLEQGLLEFTAGGTTMTPVASFPDTLVLAIGISPNFVNDHTLFAGGYHGLYESTNGGTSWTYLVVPARIEDTRNTYGNPAGPPTIVYQGVWTTVNAISTASTKTFMVTNQSGNSATLNFVGSGVSWVSLTGPEQGSGSVLLDGIPQATVSLTTPTVQYQQNVWEVRGLPCGAHTLTVTSSLKKKQEIAVDAFDVWVDTCPFINPTLKPH